MNTFSRLSRIAGLTLASALTAASLLSCEEKEPVPVTIDSQPSQIAAEGGSTSFTVTAPGTWTAAVQPASDGTAAAWLTIDPASGEAGEHTVTLTAEANTAEEERAATVIVTSGSSSATVSVSQAGATAQDEPEEPEEPDTPDHTGLVKTVTLSVSSEGDYIYEFSYDDQNRITEIIRGFSEDRSEDIPIHFTYGENFVSALMDSEFGSEFDAVFDGQNRVSKLTFKESDDFYSISYDASGYITNIEYNDIDDASNNYTYTFAWSDGNIIKIEETDTLFFYYAKEYENNTNIDINWLLTCGHGYFMDQGIEWLGTAGLLGKRSASYALPCYMYNYLPTSEYCDEPVTDEEIGEERTVEVSVSYILDYTEAEYDCNLTDDRLTDITVNIPVYNITYECTGTITEIETYTGKEIYIVFDQSKTKIKNRTKTETVTYKASISYY